MVELLIKVMLLKVSMRRWSISGRWRRAAAAAVAATTSAPRRCGIHGATEENRVRRKRRWRRWKKRRKRSRRWEMRWRRDERGGMKGRCAARMDAWLVSS